MRIALGQLLSTHDSQHNLERVRELARRAGEDRADLLVLPEATMFAFGRSLRDVAEPLDGPWATAVSELAREHSVAIVAGMFTPGDGDRVRNTAVIALPDGTAHTGARAPVVLGSLTPPHAAPAAGAGPADRGPVTRLRLVPEAPG